MKYIFKCDQCGNIFEIESIPSEISNVELICNQCLSGKVSRKYTDVPLIFRGSGFYRNDIKDKK